MSRTIKYGHILPVFSIFKTSPELHRMHSANLEKTRVCILVYFKRSRLALCPSWHSAGVGNGPNWHYPQLSGNLQSLNSFIPPSKILVYTLKVVQNKCNFLESSFASFFSHRRSYRLSFLLSQVFHTHAHISMIIAHRLSLCNHTVFLYLQCDRFRTH